VRGCERRQQTLTRGDIDVHFTRSKPAGRRSGVSLAPGRRQALVLFRPDRHRRRTLPPSIVIEGVAGHFPLDYTWGTVYRYAEQAARSMNKELGLTEEDVTLIVARSHGGPRLAENLRQALSCSWRRTGADPVSVGSRFGSDHGALFGLQAADSVSHQRLHWYRAKGLSAAGPGHWKSGRLSGS
jgi:hypothetical protein